MVCHCAQPALDHESRTPCNLDASLVGHAHLSICWSACRHSLAQIVPLRYHRQLLDIAEPWFPDADGEPPDGDLVCTFCVDFTFLNDAIDTSTNADDDPNPSKQHCTNTHNALAPMPSPILSLKAGEH